MNKNFIALLRGRLLYLWRIITFNRRRLLSYNKNYRSNLARGFTLIEVLVSALLIAIVSAGAYSSFVVVSRSVEDSRNRSMACDLAQHSLEEIRAQAHTDFDTLESHTFPNLSSDFPGFTRSISISPVAGSNELKKADVTVNWSERGNTRNYHLALLLSRPPQPLPGNIEGTITDSNNNHPVANAHVTAKHYNDTTSSFDISYDTMSDSKGEYTFADKGSSGTVIFKLKPGQWEIIVTRDGYNKYIYSDKHGGDYVNVSSSTSTTVDISLDPLPASAHIKGRFVGSFLKQYVTLYKGGSYQKYSYQEDNGKFFEFEIDFEDTNQQCFTITTGRNGDVRYYPYVYNHHCTNICSPYGTPYNYRGWSSAQMNNNGSVISCANNWTGSSTTDRICVNPGDELDLGDIQLKPVPMATLNIQLVDSNSQPIRGQVYIWERRSDKNWDYYYGWGWTDKDGRLQKQVSAEQDLFPDSSSYYIVIRGRAYVEHTGCCDTTGVQLQYSSYNYIGPLTEGDTRNVTIQIPAASDSTCGDANGYVKDGKTTGGINNVNIYISGYGWRHHITNNSGYYEIKCGNNQGGCAVPSGTRRIIADKNGYYPCDSTTNNWHSSNIWYNPANVPEAHIVANATTSQSPIYLWPKGYGTIKGRVIDASGGAPIKNAKVTLHRYTGGDKVVHTNGSGEFTFNSIIETWPPSAIAGNSYYNQSTRRHSVTVEKSNYDSKSVGSIKLNAGDTLDLGDIKLTTGGGA